MNKIMNPRYLLAALTIIIAILSCAGHVFAQSDYAVIKVENGGTITGVVKWAGPVPKIQSRSPRTRMYAIRMRKRFATSSDC